MEGGFIVRAKRHISSVSLFALDISGLASVKRDDIRAMTSSDSLPVFIDLATLSLPALSYA